MLLLIVMLRGVGISPSILPSKALPVMGGRCCCEGGERESKFCITLSALDVVGGELRQGRHAKILSDDVFFLP